MNENATLKNIYQRILGVMEEVDYIQKGDKKVNNQYRFVSHDQVNAVLHPVLVKNGIVVIPTVQSLKQDGNRTEVCLSVGFVNADNPTDKFDIMAWGYGIDNADKGPGKAVSYAYKYALLKTFCLETGDDPDQDQQVKFVPPTPVIAPPSAEVPSTETKTFEIDNPIISKKEAEELEDMLEICDPQFIANVKSYLVKTLKIDDFYKLTRSAYLSLRKRIIAKHDEMEKENG